MKTLLILLALRAVPLECVAVSGQMECQPGQVEIWEAAAGDRVVYISQTTAHFRGMDLPLFLPGDKVEIDGEIYEVVEAPTDRNELRIWPGLARDCRHAAVERVR